MLQNFQQQPVKPDANAQPHLHTIQTQGQNVTPMPSMVTPQLLQPTQPAPPVQQKTAFDKVTVRVIFFWYIRSYINSLRKYAGVKKILCHFKH